jgi:hypothetical protein
MRASGIWKLLSLTHSTSSGNSLNACLLPLKITLDRFPPFLSFLVHALFGIPRCALIDSFGLTNIGISDNPIRIYSGCTLLLLTQITVISGYSDFDQ